MSNFRFESVCGPLDAVVAVPGSKSITNRALILAALADGVSVLHSVLLADDTRLMVEALRTLGMAITLDEAECRAEVTGCGGHIPSQNAEILSGNSGTTLRFCTALCALAHEGKYKLDGIARMRRRPIGVLADVLQLFGAGIEFENEIGFPPVTVHAHGLRGGYVAFPDPQSSQFVSALLMVAPYASTDVMIEVGAHAPSIPYIKMTADMMEQFGAPVLTGGLEGADAKGPIRLIVEAPQRYAARSYGVEPDATNAMYFLSAPALVGGRITVTGLGTKSIQGDMRFLDVLAKMGCSVAMDAHQVTVSHSPGTPLRALDVDMGSMPDVAMTLAVLAVFAEGPSTIRNIGNLRIKETDRLAALSQELSKLGAKVEAGADSLRITPPSHPVPAAIGTYDDHRMAMSFALAGLRLPGLVVQDIGCTTKTFPGFFVSFEAMLRHDRATPSSF